jgi:hypothetical protein
MHRLYEERITTYMSQPMNRIRWFVDPAMDVPELRSPQPCVRGIACDYKRKNEAGILEKAWCKFVHPGEEGNGRCIWPEKRLEDGTILPAVVRLSGQHTTVGGGWVQRLKERLCWSDWAAKHGLQVDISAGPLEIERIGGPRGASTPLPSSYSPQISSPLHESSRGHRRPLRIDLGGGTMTAYYPEPEPEPAPVCAAALQIPSQFPPMEYVPQPQPPRILSHYEREYRAGWRGPVAARDQATASADHNV